MKGEQVLVGQRKVESIEPNRGKGAYNVARQQLEPLKVKRQATSPNQRKGKGAAGGRVDEGMERGRKIRGKVEKGDILALAICIQTEGATE